MNASRVSLTRITPPRLGPYVFHRLSLARKLRLMKHKALSVIHGGAGYGKTTAVAAFFDHGNKEACWYRIGEKDGELPVFLLHLVESIRMVHPAFGDSFLQAVRASGTQPGDDSTESIADLFIRACMEVKGELLLILDDFHNVHSKVTVDNWMQYFLQNMPQNVRVVILTRTRPDWPFLNVMSARGDGMELTVSDLAFSVKRWRHFFWTNTTSPCQRTIASGLQT